MWKGFEWRQAIDMDAVAFIVYQLRAMLDKDVVYSMVREALDWPHED